MKRDSRKKGERVKREQMREKEKRTRIRKGLRKKIPGLNSTVTVCVPQTAAFPLCLSY